MTSVQATAVVGEPLLRSSGQRFEVWTYDNRAELVFYGPPVGWTAPRIADGAERSGDVWQNSSNEKTATRYTLPRPAPTDKTAGLRAAAVQASFLPAYRRR
jgi:hypothetical protein